MPPERPLHTARLLRQRAEDWQAAGVTHLFRSVATMISESAEESRERAAGPPSVERSEPPPVIPADIRPASDATSMKSPSSSRPAPAKALFTAPDETGAAPPESAKGPPLPRDERVRQLTVLSEKARQCTRCTELATTRTQTVFGVGNPQARIVFVGEAPGADEDARGEPFVGKAGQLLNQIIAACRLTREELYICNVLKCRPPGNRTPLPDECANCREFLDGQLTTVAPEYIVCWGAVAAQNLLKTDVTIGKLRKKFFRHGSAKVLCTYHPSYLLRNPAAKKDVWEDMKFLFADMGVDLTP